VSELFALKKIKKLALPGLLAFATTCISAQPWQTESMKRETAAYHKVVKQASKKIQNKYGVKLSQVSGSVQPRFELVGLGFDYRGALSKDEIRKIVVDSKEILVQEMNASDEWRPYLEELGRYPCGSKEAAIILFVADKDGTDLYDPNIAVAASYSDSIVYKTKSPTQEYGYFEKLQEPYEVALAIVRGKAPAE
jgi:hypothetical protein